MSNKSDKSDKSEIDELLEGLDPIPAAISVVKDSSGTMAPTTRGDDVWKLLSQAININSNKVFHEPTCSICADPNRKEIEQKYLETNSLTEAKKVVKDKSNVDVDEVVLENHFSMHMTQGVRENQRVEYAQRIRRLYTQNLTTLDRISISFAMIMERILAINSLTPSTEETIAKIESIKSAETARLTGVLHNFLKLQASILGEMKTSGELITIPQKEFIDVFMDSIQNAKTEKEREIVKVILDKLEGLAKRTQL